MASVESEVRELTLADLIERFGPIPAHRIRTDPAPGTAVEDDVVKIESTENRLYELIDGILLEKTMGYLESELTIQICVLLAAFVREYNLGIVTGADGLMRLAPGLIRIPDVGFVSWTRLDYRRPTDAAIAPIGPELAIEVLSKGNSKQEMADKLVDYFDAGARLVWYVDPRRETVTVYLASDQSTILRGDDLLTGGDVLPGFAVTVRSLLTLPDPPEPPDVSE